MEKLIIFDLDGTIIDTRADLANAVNMTREHFRLPALSKDEIVGYVGNGLTKLMERSFHDKPEVDIKNANSIFMKFYSDYLIIETALYPGVTEGLERIAEKKYPMAVLSNKPGELCRKITAHFGLGRYFFTVMGGGDASGLKPEPGGIFDIIKDAGERGFSGTSENIWIIGDNYTDLDAAKNAGIKSIFCTFGFGNRRDSSSNYSVSNFNEIAGLLL